ncbi:MAG: hypothetical protein QM734_11700 [Cyclobacteriaceae bacterium]
MKKRTFNRNEKISLLEQQRLKVKNQKIFGIWCDFNETTEFKIFPSGKWAGIKIWRISNLVLMEEISRICGVREPLKRKNWKGFDIVTHLGRYERDSLFGGIVKMPYSSRRNFVDIHFTNDNKASLEFFFETLNRLNVVRNDCGIIRLKRVKTESNARGSVKPKSLSQAA